MWQTPTTPESRDGMVTAAKVGPGSSIDVELMFQLDDWFLDLVDGLLDQIVFAARSRLTRIGIDVAPIGPLTVQGNNASLTARVVATLPEYGLDPHLKEVIVPGLRLGRLVLCPPERRLDTEEILAAVSSHELQLPASYAIDALGRFTIQPHRLVFDLVRDLDRFSLETILAREDGTNLLNRIQVPRPVENVVLAPGHAVITSFSMFLHRHYVVLDRAEEGHQGQGTHLHSVVFDPISTRGTRVFLAFTNDTDKTIVNPSVAASVYEAFPRSRSKAGQGSNSGPPRISFSQIRDRFDDLESAESERRYSGRRVAIVKDLESADKIGPLDVASPRSGSLLEFAADRTVTRDAALGERYGTRILSDLEAGAATTALLSYFPNTVEHTQICAAAVEGKIDRLVFRRASFEHGPFLSAHDHARLADYRNLGVRVHWCNDDREQLATHEFRGLRGYFMDHRFVDQFENALIIAMYGSAAPLHEDEAENVERLLSRLKTLFGPNTSFVTGGGPGAMLQITEAAKRLGLLVGANYIETVDQKSNLVADFYQSFQDRSRHSRQRWFEVASFQIFCAGGVGTLEEIGLTLTDMKLGVIELSPLVFFGRARDDNYWTPLFRQLERFVEEGRGPEWLLDHTLVTNDPDEVCGFYKRVLELG